MNFTEVELIIEGELSYAILAKLFAWSDGLLLLMRTCYHWVRLCHVLFLHILGMVDELMTGDTHKYRGLLSCNTVCMTPDPFGSWLVLLAEATGIASSERTTCCTQSANQWYINSPVACRAFLASFCFVPSLDRFLCAEHITSQRQRAMICEAVPMLSLPAFLFGRQHSSCAN